MRHLNKRISSGLIVAALAAGSLSACSPSIDNRGYRSDPQMLEVVRPGVDNKKSVRMMLGNPSLMGTFDEDVWYYVSRRTENFAFFEEKLLDQKIVVIKFSENGHVTKVANVGINEARNVDTVGRKTPTRGRELGFFEQVFGNMGRFNNKNKQGGGGGR